jgi:hypothetical protein
MLLWTFFYFFGRPKIAGRLHPTELLCPPSPPFCSAEGRPMRKIEWNALIKATKTLSADFENITIDFDDQLGCIEASSKESPTDVEHQVQSSS